MYNSRYDASCLRYSPSFADEVNFGLEPGEAGTKVDGLSALGFNLEVFASGSKCRTYSIRIIGIRGSHYLFPWKYVSASS